MSRADESFERDEWLVSFPPAYKKIMVVEFNTGGANYIPVQQSASRQANASPAADSSDSTVSFSSQSLQDTLKQSAQVRPGKVAQANALLSDGTYPSEATLNRLAGFLAKQL
jgi:hypothetical protein